MKKPRNKRGRKTVESLTHEKATRKNIPTAEYQSVMQEDDRSPVSVAFERRNRDLDPQFLWRGKDEQDWSDLVVHTPPLYIQEKVHPKVLVDDLMRQSDADQQADEKQTDLFADFNGLPDDNAKTEFYQHDANWSNRMILGDSLQVMASLAEREGLRGQVQCIYFDPPYGIKFNSNFQWSTTSRDVKDGKIDHITREPEQVKAFRDTWRDGIHSYLTYLRDRLTVARDLLTDSGSIFVQIGDENVHRVRALMDEVFGEENAFAAIIFRKKNFTSPGQAINDYILHFAKNRRNAKIRALYGTITNRVERPDDASFQKILTLSGDWIKPSNDEDAFRLLEEGGKYSKSADRVISQHHSEIRSDSIWLRNQSISPGFNAQWAFDPVKGIPRLGYAGRLHLPESGRLSAFVAWEDVPRRRINNLWNDTAPEQKPDYVVQTSAKVIARCIQMTTDPGDLVLDPTCGSGTTAYVAEQWGRRWITIDTSRVALALARARVMGARYHYYLLADSPEGLLKEAEITRSTPSSRPTYRNIRHGFVYERVPHITLKSIANNDEIDVIWERFQEELEPLREQLNESLSQSWEEWEIPRKADKGWSEEARDLHRRWWERRIARQKEIDSSIAAKADTEYLYDKPFEDRGIARVAGPFTVESLSPHRVLGVDEDDEPMDMAAEAPATYGAKADGDQQTDFAQMILENLKTAGVQQASKEDKIDFTSLTPWPGDLVCAEGRYLKAVSNGGGG